MTASSPSSKQSKLDAFVGTNGGSSSTSNSAANGNGNANGNGKASSGNGNSKRPRPDGTDVPPEAKKSKGYGSGSSGTYRAFPANPPEPNEIGKDANETLLAKFEKAYQKQREAGHASANGGAVIHWMRMKDIRLKDNKALSLASETAQKLGKNLVILHVLSPQDFVAHDRAPIRIDFVLRNLAVLQAELDTFNIPLVVRTLSERKKAPSQILEIAKEWSASHIFANLEYEVDELRRDTTLCELAVQEPAHKGIALDFQHDYVILKPGTVTTKESKPYSVFSPFHRNWSSILATNLHEYSKEYAMPAANPDSIRNDETLGKLFEEKIPDKVEGFEVEEGQYKQRIHGLFPTGTDAAEEMLCRFMRTKARKGQFKESPLAEGAEEDPSHSRVALYSDGRSNPSIDGGSRLSPYLAAGILSIRACLRAILSESPNGKLPMTRDTGLGSWTQEICFRDFYQHVMVAWPRVSMGRNFLLKYEAVQWDDDPDNEKLKAWEEGRTGYPLIDAGMRQMRVQGWMHNRVRMAVASFLVKDLLINWKEGERIFSKHLIDGDLGSNNAGWQWSASTGTDPQPYFRIFNPINQSEKFDPDGEYIRYFVPELKHVKGKAIHEPHKHLKISEFKATGYPKPIVDHAKARKKAIARFKEPGTTADE